MAKTLEIDEPIKDLTVQELRNIIRQLIREETSSRWRIDDDGNIIFLFEEDYINYIDKRKGESPSDINAFFIDDQGFTVRYIDETIKAKAKRRIEKAKQDIANGKGLSLEEAKKRINSKG